MKLKKAIVFGVVILTLTVVNSINAETLKCNSYIGFSYGSVHSGDDEIDEIFGAGNQLNVIANFNIHSNTDIFLSAGRAWATGSYSGVGLDYSEFFYSGEIYYSFNPKSTLNPYIGAGLRVVDYEIDASTSVTRLKNEVTEVGYTASGGVEFRITDSLILDGNLDYFYIDTDDIIIFETEIGYWVTKALYTGISGSYNLESEDRAAVLKFILNL